MGIALHPHYVRGVSPRAPEFLTSTVGTWFWPPKIIVVHLYENSDLSKNRLLFHSLNDRSGFLASCWVKFHLLPAPPLYLLEFVNIQDAFISQICPSRSTWLSKCTVVISSPTCFLLTKWGFVRPCVVFFRVLSSVLDKTVWQVRTWATYTSTWVGILPVSLLAIWPWQAT